MTFSFIFTLSPKFNFPGLTVLLLNKFRCSSIKLAEQKHDFESEIPMICKFVSLGFDMSDSLANATKLNESSSTPKKNQITKMFFGTAKASEIRKLNHELSTTVSGTPILLNINKFQHVTRLLNLSPAIMNNREI